MGKSSQSDNVRYDVPFEFLSRDSRERDLEGLWSGDLGYKGGIHDQQPFRFQIRIKLIARSLVHRQKEIKAHHFGIIDLFVADDDFRFAGTSSRLRPVTLSL